MTAPKTGYVRVYKQGPDGKYKIVRVHSSKLTPEQLKAAKASPLNKVSPSSKPAADAEPKYAPIDEAVANTSYMTDPIYQSERADLDYERSKVQRRYDELLGTNGIKGQIDSDWESAINALTRGTRQDTSAANAGLSGANLAGSGIARKQLQDIGAEFLAAKQDKDTERTRLTKQATDEFSDFNTMYGAKDLASQREAIERYKRLHEYDLLPEKKPAPKPAQRNPALWGSGPVKPPTKNPKNFNPFAHAPAPAPGKVKAPKGKKYVKNPVTGKYTLKAV